MNMLRDRVSCYDAVTDAEYEVWHNHKLERVNIDKNYMGVFYKGREFSSDNFGRLYIVGKIKDQTEYFLVKFEDGTLIKSKGCHIENGKIKNPNHPRVYRTRGF